MSEPKQSHNSKHSDADATQTAQQQPVQNELEQLTEKIFELEKQLSQAKDKELRAIADYQNLQRRSREEYSNTVKFATKALISDLLEPLEHLSMTAEQMQNKILDMVLSQLWVVLKEHGLQELQVMGKPYDVQTMEVVDLLDGATEKDGVVVKIVKRGYSLNGQVIQHAKVAIGKK